MMPNARYGFDEKSVTARYGAAAVAKFLQTVRATNGVAETWVSEEDRIFVKLKNFQIICLPDLNIETLHGYIRNMGQTRARTQSDASGYKSKVLSSRLASQAKRDRSNSDVSSASYLQRLYKQFSQTGLTLKDKKPHKTSDSALDRKCSLPLHNNSSQATEEVAGLPKSPGKEFQSGRRHSEHFQKLTANEDTCKPVKASDESVSQFPPKAVGTGKAEHFSRVEKGVSNPPHFASLQDLSRPSMIANHNEERSKRQVGEALKEWHGANVDLGGVNAGRCVNSDNASSRFTYDGRNNTGVETLACSANLKDYAKRRSSETGQTGLSLRDIKKLRDIKNKTMRKSSSPMISLIFGSMNDVGLRNDTVSKCDVKNNKEIYLRQEKITFPATAEQNKRDPIKSTVANTLGSHDTIRGSPDKVTPSEDLDNGQEDSEFVRVESPTGDSEKGTSEKNDHCSLTEFGDKDNGRHERDLASVFQRFQNILPQSQKHRKSRTKIQRLFRRLSMISLATSDPTQDQEPEKKNWARVINIAGTGESEAICIPGADTLGGLPDGDCKSISPSTLAGQVKPNYGRRMSCPVIFEDDESEHSTYTDTSPSPSELSNVWPIRTDRENSPVGLSVSVPSDHVNWTCEATGFCESLSDQQAQKESEMINDNSGSSSDICGVTFIVHKRSNGIRNQNGMTDRAVPENQIQNTKGLAECLGPPSTDSEKDQQQQVFSQEQTCTEGHEPNTNPDLQDTSGLHQFSTSIESTTSKAETNSPKPKRCFTDSSISISSYAGDSSDYLTDVSSSPETDCESSP